MSLYYVSLCLDTTDLVLFCGFSGFVFSLLYSPIQFRWPYIAVKWLRVTVFTPSGWSAPMHAMVSLFTNGAPQLMTNITIVCSSFLQHAEVQQQSHKTWEASLGSGTVHMKDLGHRLKAERFRWVSCKVSLCPGPHPTYPQHLFFHILLAEYYIDNNATII